MVGAIQEHIRSLNFGYRSQLRSKGVWLGCVWRRVCDAAQVTYMNALGKMVDPHTIVATDKKGKETVRERLPSQR